MKRRYGMIRKISKDRRLHLGKDLLANWGSEEIHVAVCNDGTLMLTGCGYAGTLTKYGVIKKQERITLDRDVLNAANIKPEQKVSIRQIYNYMLKITPIDA